MFYFRAFIAGLVIPSILLPIALLIAAQQGKNAMLTFLPVHALPLIWGAWNVFYFAFLRSILPGNAVQRMSIAGAILGLILGAVAVFIYDVPGVLGFSHTYHYAPLIVAPILYAIVWGWLVRLLNNSFDLRDK